MNEEPDNEEFDDADAEALLESEVDEDLEAELRKIEKSARRKGPKNPDPAWRKLERMREERMTAALIMDFEDYDIGVLDGIQSDDSDDGIADGFDDEPLPQAASG
jgi:hypothetical protein